MALLVSLPPRLASAGMATEATWVATIETTDAPPTGGLPSAVRPAWLVAGKTFLALVLAGAAIAVMRVRRDLLSRAATVPAALFLLAVAVRFAARAGPSDIRDVLGILGSQRRAGWSSYLDLVFSVLPPIQESVWNLHRVVGALAVPLFYAVLRARFALLVAIAGTTALSVLPLVARFDATDTQYVPLCTAFLAAIVALDRFARSGSRWTLALALGLLTVAMQLRPDGPWLVVPAALLFACHRDGWRALWRPSALAVVACFVAVNVPFSVWSILSHRAGNGSTPSELRGFVLVGALILSPWFDLAASPLPMTLLVITGAFLARRTGRSAVLWLVATLIAVPIESFAVGQLCHARLHLPSIHLACGLAGIAIAALITAIERRRALPLGRRLATALAVAIPILAVLPRVDFLWRLWTPQAEFARFRESVRPLGPRPTVVTLIHGRDGGFVPFSDPGTVALWDLADFAESPPRGAAVVYYYRAGNCVVPSAFDSNAGPFHLAGGCQAFESRYDLTPLWEAQLPALPYRGERYMRDPVPVGLYRIEPRAGEVGASHDSSSR